MSRRVDLRFDTYDDAIADIQRLAAGPYARTGKWRLNQVCRHLSFYYKASLDGFPLRLPWIVRATIGKWAKKKAMEQPIGKPGTMTAPVSVFEDNSDDAAAAAEAIALLERLKAHQGPMHRSEFYGELTNAEWQRIHLNHSSHHLSFLVPGQS